MISCKFITDIKNLLSICKKPFQRNLSSCNNTYDLVIVGGGIVGTSTAREMKLRHPTLNVALLEKEQRLAAHQSSRNSGVIHADFIPGTLKALTSKESYKLIYKYCDEKNIPYEKCGKLIVAQNDEEIERLMLLYQAGLDANIPDLKILNGKQIKDIEPFCIGSKALWCPNTGIVDWSLVTENFGEDFKQAGGIIHLNYKVTNFKENLSSNGNDYPVNIIGEKQQPIIRARYVLTCAGLYSDYLAELTGCQREPRIVPFRGEYLLLRPDKNHMISGNIYAVPDPRYPSLSVHFTRCIDGSVLLGPSVVLAYQREGYKWTDINLSEFSDTLLYPGFWRMMRRYLRIGFFELFKSFSKPLQTNLLENYIPGITKNDVSPGPTGTRAQALDREGTLLYDFVFDRASGDNILAQNIIHCRNATSPSATCSLVIAKTISDHLEKEFGITNACNLLRRNSI